MKTTSKKKEYEKPKITCRKKMDAMASAVCDSLWLSWVECRIAEGVCYLTRL